jgi:aldoxime dehydratase
MATFDEPVSLLTSDYLGLQTEGIDSPEAREFIELIRRTHDAGLADAPEAWEIVSFTDGAGVFNLVHLGYWRDPSKHATWALTSPLATWYSSLDAATIGFGAWHEVIQVPTDRLEAIVSKEGWSFGLANCPGIRMRVMTMNGYFGAARDRFPLSAIDPLEAPAPLRRRSTPIRSRGRRVRAECGHNTAIIRSGQHWASASGDQLQDYENELQPKLMAGMDYLRSEADREGVLSLRVMTNRDPETLRPLRQTSVLGHFNSLEPLEQWAESHVTHAAIYTHAIEKQREYGNDRAVVTWHEVFITTRNANFEYVNCHEQTGIMPFAQNLMSVDDRS